MFDVSRFYVDPTAETDGVWEDIGHGARLKVARLGNPNHAAEFQKVPSSVRRQIERNVLDNSQAENILVRMLAKTILLDWEGISDNGKPVKYSQEMAEKYLKEYKEFRALVMDLANDQERFRGEEREEAAKNSEAG